MAKRTVSILLTLILVITMLCTVSFSTYAVDTDDYSYEIINGNEIEITQVWGAPSTFDVPKTIDGKKVTSIGEGAFYDNSNLVSVTLPDTVTNISENAFSGCRSLKEVKLPEGLKTIGDFAFFSCTAKGFDEITIPNSVTSIGDCAFGYQNAGGWIAACTFTIKGYKDSEAQRYANDNDNITFIEISSSFVRGDADMDKNVSIMDALVIQKYCANLIGISEIDLNAANVTGGDVVSVLDAVKIQKYLAGLINVL